MSPKGILLEVCPFCGTSSKERGQQQGESYGHRLLDMIQKRGKEIYRDKRMLSNFIGDILHDNVRLQKTMRLAVESDVASKLLSMAAFDEQTQKSEIIRITHLFANENGLEPMRAADAVRTLAIGLGVSDIVLEYATASQLPPTNLLKKVFTQEEALKIRSEHFDIPYGYTDIEKEIFGGFSWFGSPTITKITIPESVTRIGESAFDNSYIFDIKSLLIPKSVTRIGAQAFRNAKIESVIIAGNVERIGEGAFSACAELREVIISGNVQCIGETAFAHCAKLRTVTLPNRLINIESCAFANCEELQRITLPDGVKNIGVGAFTICHRLKKIIIPDSVSSIGEQTFDKADNVTVFCSNNSYAYEYCMKNNIRTNTSHAKKSSDAFEYEDDLPEECLDSQISNDGQAKVNIDEYLDAAEQGNAEAQFKLAMCYANEEDYDKAMEWLISAAKQGEVNALCKMADIHQERDPETAFDMYKEAAEQGFVRAQSSLGMCYAQGIGVVKDQQQAMYWISKAAEQGDIATQFALGMIYLQGTNVDKDEARAFQWIEKAANQGLPNAQKMMSRFYREGICVDKDIVQSVSWLKKAAEQGDENSQFNLSYCYLNGIGLETDSSKAMKWCRKAAEQGDAASQCLLADCYADVNNVNENPVKAFEWYMKSAEQGYAEAQRKLAFCYALGDGVDSDDVQSAIWLQKAAEQDDALAQYELGLSYTKGRGVENDPVIALNWYSKAAEQGLILAQYNLANCYKEGLGTEKNMDQAAKWYMEAANRGNGNALFELALCYIEGAGVENDPTRAFEFFKMLIDDGHTMIEKAVGMIYPQIIDMFDKYLTAFKDYSGGFDTLMPEIMLKTLEESLAQEKEKLPTLTGVFSKGKREKCETRISELTQQIDEIKAALAPVTKTQKNQKEWTMDDVELGNQIRAKIQDRMSSMFD
jgi:hypothetical protein